MKKTIIILGMIGIAWSTNAMLVVDYTPGSTTLDSRNADSDTTTGDAWSFSDIKELFSTAGGQNDTIYGGLNTSWSVALDYDPFVRHLAASTSVQTYINPGNGSDTAMKGIYVWKQSAFLNGGDSALISFSSGDSISINFAQLTADSGSRDIRFVIKQDDTYYVSDQSKTDGVIGSYSIDPSMSGDWAEISTDGNYTVGAFGSLSFTNVQAVGFYFEYARAGNPTLIRFNDFQVNASADVTDPPPPTKDEGGDPLSIRVIGGTNVVLSWTGTNTANYSVQQRESLINGSWSNILENISGSDGIMSVTNPSNLAAAFYQIVDYVGGYWTLSPDSELYSTDPLSVSAPFGILFIGDSNTQGELTMSWIIKMLRERVGYAGTGYRTFVKDAALGWGSPSAHPGFDIQLPNDDWQEYDMAPGAGLETPYIAPDGLAEIGAAGAAEKFKFIGDSFDIYYLQQNLSSNCQFSIQLDGGTPVTIDTAADEPKVMRYTVDGLARTNHEALVTAMDDGVVMLGFDVKSGLDVPRVICHKWGNGSADSRHYVNVDERIFTESLHLLDPDLVIIILGTNDHNHNLTKEEFSSNLIEIVRRVKSVDASTQTMLVSTFRSNTVQGQPGGLLDEYRDYSYPLAAEASGSYYWDMSADFEAEFGSWPEELMRDAWHVDIEGAGWIADGLWSRIAGQYGDLFLGQ